MAKKKIPSRERSHIPPNGKRKIMDSKLPFLGGYVFLPWRGYVLKQTIPSHQKTPNPDLFLLQPLNSNVAMHRILDRRSIHCWTCDRQRKTGRIKPWKPKFRSSGGYHLWRLPTECWRLQNPESMRYVRCRNIRIAAVAGSEIRNNHLGCMKNPVKNRRNYQPQMVQDFFHQRYVLSEHAGIYIYI